MPREERDYSSLQFCEHIDLSIAVVWEDKANWPTEWTCSSCMMHHVTAPVGERQTFEWVHRDYTPSGLRPGTFRASVEPVDEEDCDD